MTDIEKIEAFADYEPYAHDLPCVTIKSKVYLDALELLKEYAVIKETISDGIHETAKMFRRTADEQEEEKQTQEDKGGILYHHYCIKCGWDWWTDEAFPNRCSKCDCELI